MRTVSSDAENVARNAVEIGFHLPRVSEHICLVDLAADAAVVMDRYEQHHVGLWEYSAISWEEVCMHVAGLLAQTREPLTCKALERIMAKGGIT